VLAFHERNELIQVRHEMSLLCDVQDVELKTRYSDFLSACYCNNKV